MTIFNHTHKTDRLFAGTFCAFMRSDRQFAITAVNNGWNFALGSGVT